MALPPLDPGILKGFFYVTVPFASSGKVTGKGKKNRIAKTIRLGLCEHSVPQDLQIYSVGYG